MLSKIWASSVLVLALCLQASAHAAVAPILGLLGDATRSDVQRPVTANPCGAGVNIAADFDNSTAVLPDATGSYNFNATCFNGGVDGSLNFTAQVDATGNGTKFVPMTITQNGNNSPPQAQSETLVASLPNGTKCTGGKAGNQCLVQFISASGFGNCVVVSQSTAGGAGNSNTTSTGNSNTSNGTGACSAKRAKKTGNMVANATAPAGTRMARSLLAELEDRGEEAAVIAKRGSSGWVWV